MRDNASPNNVLIVLVPKSVFGSIEDGVANVMTAVPDIVPDSAAPFDTVSAPPTVTVGDITNRPGPVSKPRNELPEPTVTVVLPPDTESDAPARAFALFKTVDALDANCTVPLHVSVGRVIGLTIEIWEPVIGPITEPKLD